MTRTKIVFSILLATIFLAAQFIAVGAAPATQETIPITGTIENIELETEAETGTTTVILTILDEFGETQTISLSVEEATALGLVVDEGSGPVVDEEKIGTTIESDPETDIPEKTMDETQHPVGSSLSDFFTDLLGVEYDTIMEFHNDGVGFGVIAQVLWMTNGLEGDTEIFAAILDAKQNKDFSGIELPDGSTPTNWGQFRKAVMSDRDKAKENLGAVMSGRAEENQAEDEIGDGQFEDEQVKPQNNGKSENKGNGKDKNKDKGNGKDKNKDK